jgi:hypothetical protein
MRAQPAAATGCRAAPVAAPEFGETIANQRNDAIHRRRSIGAVGLYPEHVTDSCTQ